MRSAEYRAKSETINYSILYKLLSDLTRQEETFSKTSVKNRKVTSESTVLNF